MRTFLSVVLIASLIGVLRTPTLAAAAGPSTELERIDPVPVTRQVMGGRGPDQATSLALSGNQPPGSASKDGGGTPGASPLSPSAGWQVSGHTGDFTWSYPLRVPPAPGGLEPRLALSYSSSIVDGRTSATNNQASWVGDGWDLSAGFVERVYGACATDGHPQSGDLCWRTDNAIASFPGGGGQLIRERDNLWRTESDNGARIERLSNVLNGDNDGEAWKITTVDGTQYFFGSRPESGSTWTVPVVGDDSGEPCHGSAHCAQAWRWNLDRVVDPHGNQILYRYDAESHTYGSANLAYTRGGTLRAADYAGGRVDFLTADRCVPGSECTQARKENWPDVPWDADRSSPSFWTSKRLAQVRASVLTGGSYQLVESWTLEHQFPNPGDGEKAALWLRSITRKGHVGGEIALPPVVFEGQRLANRVHMPDVYAPLNRYRINAIITETGGVIDIAYRASDCTPTSLPAAAQGNTKLCYPVKWTPKDSPERTDWFIKYVVAAVGEHDRMGSTLAHATSYEYLDGAAWHYDTSEFTEDSRRTWSEYRGFARVRVRSGSLPDPSGPVSMTEHRYHRGMDGDTGPDFDWLAGFQHYTAVHLGDTETIVTKTVSTPTWQGPHATRGAFKSYLVHTGQTQTFTSARQTRTVSTYDDRGLVTAVDDLGDVATPEDDRCTRTTYARNTDAWILNRASRTEVVGVSCATAATLPGDGLADVQTAYDGRDFGQPPSKGDPRRVRTAQQWGVFQDTVTAEFDPLGRPTKTIDALGRTTTTSYSPTQTVTTNPLGHTVTTTLEPAWGLPTKSIDANNHLTETTYDALGRISEVWLPNRSRAKNPSGNERYAYVIRNDAPTVVSTTRLGPTGNYVTTNTLYDGLLRVRQTQTPAAGGGRLIVDTRYDTHGRAYLTTSPFYTDGGVDDHLWLAQDTLVPALTFTRHDGVERPIATEFRVHDHVTKQTTMAYGADRVHVTPPAGAPPTTTVTDAGGRTVELIEAGKSTRYTYSKSGQLASITDPAGNTWRYEYDLLGRQTRADDVDKGGSTSTYDAAGQLATVTDARGSTLSYEYDGLGRQTRLKRGAEVLAEWTYDTVLNGIGMPARATRYQEGKAYITEISGYSSLKQPTRTKVTVPDIASSFTTYFTYNTDGSRKEELLPAIGDLPAETITHTYDDAGRPIKTYGGFPGQTVYYVSDTEYTRYGEATRLHLGEGTQRVWLTGYHQLGTRWPERMVVDAEAPAPKVSDLTLRYDQAGNVTSSEELDERQCFRYDAHRRLTEAWTPVGDCSTQPLGGPAPYRQTFTYDDAGNRTSDVARQYTYTNGHRLNGFGYDAAGNTITRPGQTLEWDAEGHLSKVVDANGETSFAYTADGDRLLRKDPSATTIYLAGQELRIDRATGVRTATRYYSHSGAVVAVRAGGRLTWIAGDHQNTAQLAIDAQTLTPQRRRFDPFGKPRGDQGAFPDDKGFLGGTADASTGLTHLGAREYDPALGRFISVDPILAPDDPQQLNGYGYANNSPVTYSDPSGLFRVSCPDGECRFGGWAKNASPASTWGRTKAPRHRCADGAKSCRSAGPTTTKMSSGMVVRRSIYGTTVNGMAIPHMKDETALINGMNRFAGEGYFDFYSDTGHRSTLWALIGACETYAQDACPTELYNWAHEMQKPNIERELEMLGMVPMPGGSGLAGLRGGVPGGRTGGVRPHQAPSCHSFDGATPVRMADGTDKPIRDVELGDEVLATDPETGRTEPRAVVTLYLNRDHDLVDLTVRTAGGQTTTVKTTATHPFWVDSRLSWVDAAALRAGDLLHSIGGAQAEVVGVQRFTGDRLMHDLTVEGIHTYYVVATRTPVLVHNNNGACPVHPIPGYVDPRSSGPCTCRGGAQSKGAPERHPGEGVPAQPRTATEATARSAKIIDDAMANSGDPTLGLALGTVAAATGIRQGLRRIGKWWRPV